MEEENSMLKSLLSKHGIAYEKAKPETVVLAQESEKQNSAMHSLSLQEKIDLFRSIFKGREDVFAKRWYSDTSKKSGYQPVCEREWNREFCDKRKHKCAECPNRLFAPLTNEHIYNHLAGKDDYGRDILGVYPIMDNNFTLSLLFPAWHKNTKKNGKVLTFPFFFVTRLGLEPKTPSLKGMCSTC